MIKNLTLTLLGVVFALAGCQQPKVILQNQETIRLNQIGYYPQSVKQFLLIDSIGEAFQVINQAGQSVFEGQLTNNGTWDKSGEHVMMGDFSEVIQPGSYTLLVDNLWESYPFEIKTALYQQHLNAAIKSFYFQRASMPITETFGGIHHRKEGHADDSCLFHPSTGHSTGTLNSSGGWYDAGDYGKYVGNAAFSTGKMLLLLEQFPDIIPDNTLNIPESGNGIGDLYDELKYELDWLMTMQDDDGGVFFKVTAKGFSDFVMPEDYDLERFVIGKGTASTLDFAAVMAQAARVYKKVNPDFSKQALIAAKKAWQWAMVNDNIPFTNPKGISTGEYGDDHFSDDFYWAAAELFISTQDQQYFDYLTTHPEPYIHEQTNSWKFFVRNNGFQSLLENSDLLDKTFKNKLTEQHIQLADSILTLIANNPYRIGANRFEWGSNSDVLNQAVILCMAHRLTGNKKYLSGAEQINDYILGKNATGYCFLTGFGSKKVMFPHHRPSGADGVAEHIPGFIVGGPNGDKQDASDVQYSSAFPAKSYMDLQASYASNEVCLNWNAPAIYVMGYLQQTR
jgi:endoglucanase